VKRFHDNVEHDINSVRALSQSTRIGKKWNLIGETAKIEQEPGQGIQAGGESVFRDIQCWQGTHKERGGVIGEGKEKKEKKE